jgi:hypothetical protein
MAVPSRPSMMVMDQLDHASTRPAIAQSPTQRGPLLVKVRPTNNTKTANEAASR